MKEAATFTTAHNFLDLFCGRDTQLNSHSQDCVHTMREHVRQVINNVKQLPENTYELQLYTDEELAAMTDDYLSLLLRFATQPSSLFLAPENANLFRAQKSCLQCYSEQNINDLNKRIRDARK